ncbi:MAG TPA: amino acid adenylation domain-containing protein, partial [Asanoa sp.]|nr:amino acid adenylation domain-containing protein [Asanoa sp.]
MRASLAGVDLIEAPGELLPPLTRSGPLALYSAQPAPSARTLLDILGQTAHRHPHAPAVDDGVTLLSYRALEAEIDELRKRIVALGIGVGDRVGVRVPSGTVDLYVSILAVLAAGAAYVPVDADDPDERAELVFAEADVCAVVGPDRTLAARGTPHGQARRPGPDDDAWIIFTSGSTGRPKGVAVTHRSAAAFVDVEARLFLADEPMGPGDRVLAGLSVAFDASCEEMWLAWRHGACLVPAPRSLVRSGMDLGPWLVEQRITVVSTVPTLAALWPAGALDDVRLLIFGGEACPPELAERLAVEGREVWNTYGPTEATVVACATQLTGEGPVRIGLPLDGWELAVVDAWGDVVAMGEVGELVIGGVGLARYLDAAKDAEKFGPLPSLGWSRAYRSGDLVRAEPEGLLFVGRGDEQVKLGGRRIELGEVDAALQALPGVVAAAAAVRTTRHGNQLLVGYLVPASDDGFDKAAAVERLRAALPAALVPLIAVVDGLPTRTSGKVDRAALPWPLPELEAAAAVHRLEGTEAWVAECWGEILGVPPGGTDDDFFASGGSSLSAAQLLTLLRGRFPGASVSDVYQHPTLRALARRLDEFGAAEAATRTVLPTPRRTGLAQTVLMLPLFGIVGLRWVVILAALNNVLALSGSYPWAPTVSWWWVLLGWLLVISPPGRIAISAGGARLLLRGLRPGSYPRG